MIFLLGILLALFGLLGGQSASSDARPAAVTASGSIRVVARACPEGVAAGAASADRCPVWPGGAAMQATDLNGNAWGMNASRDPSLPGNPVVYSLDDLAFGAYTLGDPVVPAGYSSFVVDGARTGSGGLQVDLSQENPHAELVVYFLMSS